MNKWKAYKIGKYLASLLRSLYLFFPGILFLVIYYFIIVVMPIGQDMLMQAAEYSGPLC